MPAVAAKIGLYLLKSRRGRKVLLATLAFLVAVLAALVVIVVSLLAAAASVLASPCQSPAPGGLLTGSMEPSAEAVHGIPSDYLELYQRAGQDYGIDWAVLAGIGKVETDHGRYQAGCEQGPPTPYGAARGPMAVSRLLLDLVRGGRKRRRGEERLRPGRRHPRRGGVAARCRGAAELPAGDLLVQPLRRLRGGGPLLGRQVPLGREEREPGGGAGRGPRRSRPLGPRLPRLAARGASGIRRRAGVGQRRLLQDRQLGGLHRLRRRQRARRGGLGRFRERVHRPGRGRHRPAGGGHGARPRRRGPGELERNPLLQPRRHGRRDRERARKA